MSNWQPVISLDALPRHRVLVTNRFEDKDDNGAPRLVWVGLLYKGTCGQTHCQTDEYQSVKSVTHIAEIPK